MLLTDIVQPSPIFHVSPTVMVFFSDVALPCSIISLDNLFALLLPATYGSPGQPTTSYIPVEGVLNAIFISMLERPFAATFRVLATLLVLYQSEFSAMILPSMPIG